MDILANYDRFNLDDILLTVFKDRRLVNFNVDYKIALIDLKQPAKTRVAERIQLLFNEDEWAEIVNKYTAIQKKADFEKKHAKDELKKRRGFGILSVNHFIGDWSNINAINDRPQYAGVDVFKGKVKGDWLIESNGKRHKISGNQVVEFKFFKTEEEYKKINRVKKEI